MATKSEDPDLIPCNPLPLIYPSVKIKKEFKQITKMHLTNHKGLRVQYTYSSHKIPPFSRRIASGTRE